MLTKDSQTNIFNENNEKFIVEIPKLSNTEINITTPKNKTYAEPMSGYYPATYGFENETDGTSGTYIGFIDAINADCSVDLVPELDGHSKILYYTTPIAHRWVRNYFDSSQSSGTVEFWIRLGETDKTHVIYLNDGATGSISLSWFEDGYVKFDNRTNGGDFEIIDSYNALQWYHVRIEFDVATDWHLWIDGVSKDGGLGYGYVNVPSDFNQFIFGGFEDNNFWLDAIGYSWDDDYNIGDNLEEGLLVSFDLGFSPDWQAYSLDGQVNKSICGNTTISMPNEGLHNIQVFGNDSLGEMFESDMRYFTIKYPPITIITPENKTYAAPMSGYYPASYGFENDNVGDNPEGWSTTEPSGCGFVEVDTSLNGHNKIVEVRKNGGTTRVLIEKSFEENHTEGTVEYWLYKDTASGTDGTIIYLVGDMGSAYFLIENGNLYRGPYPSRVLIASGVFSAHTWYHFRIEFDVSQGYQIYLDGILYGAGYSLPFDGSPSYIRGFRLRSHYSGCHPDYGAWLDAFSYDWDDDYNVGDNLNEGLLLSYTNRTNLDWVGYSLDGQNNRTLIGKTVIPLSGNGVHNIKVYGRNSSGFIFESPVRYFTIDIPTPQILINYPQNGDNFGLSAPYFSISISTPILDTTWYTMDNGITKIIFNGLSGTIDQNEWDKFGQGLVIIQFYINDTFGQESYSEVIINKNPNPPPPLNIDFFIVLIIISIGIAVLDVIIISIVRRKKSTRSATIGREEIIVTPQFLKCPYCQNELKPGYNFCIHCGLKLK